MDLVVLTDKPERYVGSDDWLGTFGAVSVVRRQEWGAYLTEVRLQRASGLEVEVGVTATAWAATSPVDPGTRRVITDGVRVLHDPEGLFTTLVRSCGGPEADI